ncbi:MAG TPA: aldo/keto reductase [Candidatus Humimicrobiaceae bacterium]|nr:aldo/keto reductase [Candidatus Humimicrobiaceae bacterium]
MRYVKLGNSQIEVSVIGLGAWAIGGKWWGGTNEKDSIEAIQASIDSGVNFIDTAPAYGQGLSEGLIEKALRGRRDKVVIATKCGLRWDLKKGLYFFDYAPGVPMYRYLGRESLEYELDQSLKRLGTDYIDLYQSHWQDPTTPISETMETFLKMKEKGKIRAIGVSNATLDEIKEYARYGIIDSDQEKYSAIDRGVESELLPWCEKNNVSMLAYSSMEKGLLTGKISPDRKFKSGDSRLDDPRYSAENIKKVNKLLKNHLETVAEKYNASYGHIVTAWLLKSPKVIALCGARNKNQAIENARAGNIELDGDDLKKVDDFIKEYDKKHL